MSATSGERSQLFAGNPLNKGSNARPLIAITTCLADPFAASFLEERPHCHLSFIKAIQRQFDQALLVR